MNTRIAVLIGALAGAPVHAAPSAKAAAVEAYNAGAAAFKAKDHAGALAHFERAYKLDPSPVLLYNIARCHEETGNAEKAIDGFKLYLARRPDAQDRPDVERRMRVMQAILDRQAKASAAAPPSALAAPGSSGARDRVEPTGASPTVILGWSLAGAGLLGVVVGGVFGAAAADGEAQHQEATDDRQKTDLLETAEADATAANWAFIAGGLLLASGAGLLIWDALSEDDAPAVHVTPMPNGAAVGWSTRF